MNIDLTLKARLYAIQLRKAGFTQEQADALVEQQIDILGNYTSKADFRASDLKNVTVHNELRRGMNSGYNLLRKEMNDRFESANTQIIHKSNSAKDKSITIPKFYLLTLYGMLYTLTGLLIFMIHTSPK